MKEDYRFHKKNYLNCKFLQLNLSICFCISPIPSISFITEPVVSSIIWALRTAANCSQVSCLFTASIFCLQILNFVSWAHVASLLLCGDTVAFTYTSVAVTNISARNEGNTCNSNDLHSFSTSCLHQNLKLKLNTSDLEWDTNSSFESDIWNPKFKICDS